MIKQPVEDMIKHSLEKYADMVRKISFMYLRNRDDVDDVFQEVFLKFLQNKVPFKNDQHEKAWLIRVTINKCKDLLKISGAKTSIQSKDLKLLLKIGLRVNSYDLC